MKKITDPICANCRKTITARRQKSRIGQTRFFCSKICKNKFEYGRKRVNKDTYRLKYRYVTRNGKPMGEHRWIMQQFLGRDLSPNEHVHHIDRNGLNNALENLVIVEGRSHMREHHMLDLPVETIKTLYSNGLSPRAIAKKFGVSTNAIKRRLSDSGVIFRGHAEGIRLFYGS